MSETSSSGGSGGVAPRRRARRKSSKNGGDTGGYIGRGSGADDGVKASPGRATAAREEANPPKQQPGVPSA